MATLLVIGGSGFFGKSILDSFGRGKLNTYGIERVIALARNASRLALETPELISSSVELIDGDITSLRHLPESDLIIHAASSSNAQRYMEKPEQEIANIIEGASHFCDLVFNKKNRPKVLYCSSGAVYGKQPVNLEYLNEDHDIKGDVDLDPVKSAYTHGKRQAELIFQRAVSEMNLEVCIARCFAFVGKWLPRNTHFAIGNFIRDAIQGHEIIVKAAHPVYRSYMHAEDLVDWMIRMATAATRLCPIYNVGSDEAIEIGDLALLIGKLCGVAVTTPNRGKSGIKDSIDADADRYVPLIAKARKELGLRMSYNIHDAIQETVTQISRTGIE